MKILLMALVLAGMVGTSNTPQAHTRPGDFEKNTSSTCVESRVLDRQDEAEDRETEAKEDKSGRDEKKLR